MVHNSVEVMLFPGYTFYYTGRVLFQNAVWFFLTYLHKASIASLSRKSCSRLTRAMSIGKRRSAGRETDGIKITLIPSGELLQNNQLPPAELSKMPVIGTSQVNTRYHLKCQRSFLFMYKFLTCSFDNWKFICKTKEKWAKQRWNNRRGREANASSLPDIRSINWLRLALFKINIQFPLKY